MLLDGIFVLEPMKSDLVTVITTRPRVIVQTVIVNGSLNQSIVIVIE